MRNRCATVMLTAAVLASTSISAFGAVTTTSSANGSRMYYQMGGGDPAGRSPHRGSQSIRLGLSGNSTLNYSCGKFNASLTMSKLMNKYSSYGDTIVGAIKAGIASLPMYILQRAQPGLYELIQTYIRKAEEVMAAAYKTCEQMEAEAKDGKNPYDGWVTLSMGENWKYQSAHSDGDVAESKEKVAAEGGTKGFTWVFGKQAGGAGQPPAKVVNDVTIAAYNLTLGRATTSSSSSSNGTSSRLTAAFSSADAAAAYATDVLGDTEVSSCSDSGCPSKGTKMGLGLAPKYETEIAATEQQLNTLLSGGGVPSNTDLNAASAPGVLLTRDVVDAIRALPPAEQAIAAGRLSREVALARTVDRALLLRQLLLSGQTIPEVENSKAVNNIPEKITQLNRCIDDLMFEVHTRKELVSSTATTLLDAYQRSRATSLASPVAPARDPRPFTNGRVQP